MYLQLKELGHEIEFQSLVQCNQVTTWLVDFYLPELNIWIEYKGFINRKFLQKVKALSSNHPEVYSRLIVISYTAKLIGYKLPKGKKIHYPNLKHLLETFHNGLLV